MYGGKGNEINLERHAETWCHMLPDSEDSRELLRLHRWVRAVPWKDTGHSRNKIC